MPKKIKQEDTDLYKKLLVGFSFGQLVLGFLYFMLPPSTCRPSPSCWGSASSA